MENKEEQTILNEGEINTNVRDLENRITIPEEELNNAQKRVEEAKKDYVNYKKQKKENHLICLIATIITMPIAFFLLFSGEDLTTIIFGDMSIMTFIETIATFTGVGVDLLLCIKTQERIISAKETVEGTELQILFLKNELAKEYGNLNENQKENRKKMRKQLKKQLEILRAYGANWQNFVKKDVMANWKLAHKKKLENKGIDTELYESFVRRLELKRNLGEEI